MLCYLLHSFIYSFIVPSYSPCRITVTDEYTNTDMDAWHGNKEKTNWADPGRIAHRDSYVFSLTLTTRSSEQADA